MTLSTEILTRSPLLDADDLEGEIGNIILSTRRGPVIRAVPGNDHPLPEGPMPDYVEHKEGVNQVGKLSAEAVIREYDAAVKEIEALGVELTEAAKKCEAMVAGVHAMVNEIKELAANYREEGKRYFLQIEDCSLMTSEVRTVCETLKKRIAQVVVSPPDVPAVAGPADSRAVRRRGHQLGLLSRTAVTEIGKRAARTAFN